MSMEQIDAMLKAAFMAGADRAFESWVGVSVKQHDDGAREIYKRPPHTRQRSGMGLRQSTALRSSATIVA